MIIRVFDVETTGLPKDDKPTAILQIGFTDVHIEYGFATVGEKTHQFLVNPFRANPGLEIDIGAMATHHMVKSDFDAIERTPDHGLRILSTPPMNEEIVAFACHNKEHDGVYFGGGGLPILCTLRSARAIWPDAERHGNQFLRYFLDLPVDRQRAEPAHAAGPDSYVTAHLLARMIYDGFSIEQLQNWTDKPMLLTRMPFGKHRGEAFEDIPNGYLTWLHREKPDDKDVRFSVRHHLKHRGLL